MRKGASCGLELWEGCLLWNLLQEWMRIDGSPVLLCAEWKDGRRLLQCTELYMLQNQSALGSQP